MSFGNNRKFLSANSSAKVNCASPFWREINDTWTAAPPPPAPPPTWEFAYDSSRSSSSSLVVCYASSKFSINIHKPTNKSNQTDSGCIISSSIARADSWTACTGRKNILKRAQTKLMLFKKKVSLSKYLKFDSRIH